MANVYEMVGTADQLREQVLKCLGESVHHWVADIATLTVHGGIPTNWFEQGAVFNQQGELRWWQQGETYEAVLLMEQAIDDLKPLSGHWQCRSDEILLQNLTEPRVYPNFDQYPHGQQKGKLKVKQYLRDGMMMFISPREFCAEGEK